MALLYTRSRLGCVSGVANTAAKLISRLNMCPVLLLLLLILPPDAQSQNTNAPLYYPVDEEIGPGSIIGDVVKSAQLSDRYDSQTLSQLRFQFLTQPAANFSIDRRSGLISTNGRLDRDVLCPGHLTCVVPLDIAIRPVQYFQVIKVTVEIRDLNDNTPHFPEPSIVFQVLESAHTGSTAFIVPEAQDNDSPSNSVQGYKLDARGSDTWRLQVDEEVDGSRRILLVLSDTLDRETTPHYSLQVLAYDGGVKSRTGSVEVLIEVQDANDNSPVFDQESYEVTIDENTPPMTTIARLHAEDADWGPNGQVVYSLGGRSASTFGHLFGVHNSTGQVYIKGSVDYETSSTYHLAVMARDKGPGSIPTTVSLLVNVRDLNDHAPIITANTLIATNTNHSTVSEDSNIGTFVAHITVHDPDSGLNGVFNCSLRDNTFQLQVQSPGVYHLITKGSLDRERKSAYNLSIVCTDQGSPPQTSVKHISIHISDVNDNTPVFKQTSYVAELFENNFVGAKVTQVSATDKDSGDNAHIVYGLGANDLANFEIDSQTGEVTARNSLDREKNSEFHLQVVARDSGKPLSRTATAALLVRVLDVNDERPMFTSMEHACGVEENEPAGTIVDQVSAVDADSSMYNKFTYSLLPAGSLSDAFTIDENTGEISTTRPLDRETQHEYELIAVARDVYSPSLSSTSTVRIFVIDVNDNPPHFIFPTLRNNTVQFSHKVPLGHIVTQVRAEDIDFNNKVIYEVVAGNHEGIFTMDPHSGVISVNIDMRDFPDNRTWHLEVQASDHGDTPLVTTAMLHIVLNHSLALATGGFFVNLFAGTNFFILVIVGCVSGALIVILLIVIVVLLRRQQLKRRRMQRYNCRMHALQRQAAQEMIADSDKKDVAYQNSKASYTMIPKKEPDCFTSDDNKDLMDLSHEKSRQWLETLEPNRYEATPTRGIAPLQTDTKANTDTPNGRANQSAGPVVRKECSTLPRAGNNPSPRPLSSVLEDSASDSVKSGEGSNTDSGRGHSDGDGDHSNHGPTKSVKFTPLPPPPPAPQYNTLPTSYHPSRYTRPPAHVQSFTSFRGNNNNATEHQQSPQHPPQNGIPRTTGQNGPETVAIRPQGSPILRNARKVLTPKMDDYQTVKQDGRHIYSASIGTGAERETDC